MIKKIAVGLLIFLIPVAAVAYGVFRVFYREPPRLEWKNAAQARDGEKTEEKFVAAGRTNIALLGVDTRSDDEGRADVIVVAVYDPENEKIGLISVPRDTRVRMRGGGWDKINHSYNHGGAANVVATLESFLGINIDHYVQMDFSGFERIVDAVGGVPLNVRERMYYEDPWDGPDGFVIDIKPGEQILDGKKALQFVRYRNEEGDVGRVKRQQDFLAAFYAKMSGPSMWIYLPDLAAIALGSVSTDMGFADMLKIGRTLHKNSKAGLQIVTAPGEPVYIDEISYLLPDMLTLREEVAGALGINPASGDFMREAERLAAIYQASLPDNVVYYEDLLAAEAARAAEENKSEDEKPGAEKPADEQDAKTDSRENKAPSPEKPSRQTDKAPKRQPRQLRAAVVNCSGDPASGKKMEALLQNNGVTVTEVSNGHAQNQSSIISNTYDGWVLSRLAALPFRYSLKLAKNSDAAVEAVIYVGKDFT